MEASIVSKTVSQLQFEINHLQNEILKIQNNCNHPSYECVMYSYRPGAFNPTRLCATCSKSIPGITPEEETEVRNTFYSDFYGFVKK